MIKKFFTGIIVISLLGACNKSQVMEPVSATTPAPTNFTDAHISIVNVQMTELTPGVSFAFSTLYEKDITKIEVFSGTTKKNLCSFYSAAVTADSHDVKRYRAKDAIPGTTVNYYMVKYTTSSGDWSYSPVYEIKMK